MKVLNLQCSHQHSFEGWFASEDDFQSQLSRGLVECPMCADKGVKKLPSAPRLNLSGLQRTEASTKPSHPSPAVENAQEGAAAPANVAAVTGMPAGASQVQQAAFLQALRHVMANTEDVGTRFADEARRMHYGEQEARSIRGQTTVREAVELLEEGIEVIPLPLPAAVKETLQ
jgi:hypothetical protein